MKTKVLLAYASTHGSTQEVAEAIAATLRQHEHEIDLQPAHNVRTLEGYSVVILGAPLYMFRLHKDALGFLNRHRKPLANGLPVAIFAGGSIESNDESEQQAVRNMLDKELAKFPWLKPIAIEVVGGRFDPTSLHFPWNLIPALKQKAPIDLRDWDAIRQWASTLAGQFQPVQV